MSKRRKELTVEENVAILVDGGFYQRRARSLWGMKTAEERANELYEYCKLHLYSPPAPGQGRARGAVHCAGHHAHGAGDLGSDGSKVRVCASGHVLHAWGGDRAQGDAEGVMGLRVRRVILPGLQVLGCVAAAGIAPGLTKKREREKRSVLQ